MPAIWYSDWKINSWGHRSGQTQRSVGHRPPWGEGVGGRRRVRPRDSGRKAGGPRQQQGGAQRIHRRDPSDPTAQQHHRPCGLGWGAQRTPKQNGCPHKLPGRLREREAGWSEAVEGKPETASAQASRSVGSCAGERGMGRERPAVKRGTETPRDAGRHIPARVV